MSREPVTVDLEDLVDWKEEKTPTEPETRWRKLGYRAKYTGLSLEQIREMIEEAENDAKGEK